MVKKPVSGPTSLLGQQKDYQRALAAFSRVASEPLAPARLMQHAAAKIAAVTNIRRVEILRYRPESGDLLIVAGVGWKFGVVGHTIVLNDSASPVGRSMQTGMPVVVEDIANNPELRYPKVLRYHGIVSLLNVPMMIDGRTWGVLEIDSAQPCTFDESDVMFLSTFANVLAVALRAYEADQRATAAAGQQKAS